MLLSDNTGGKIQFSHLFNCVIFPVDNYSTPRFIMPYIDDLDHFFDYSWGDAAYQFLCYKIAAHVGDGQSELERKKYLDDCLVELMVVPFVSFSEEIVFVEEIFFNGVVMSTINEYLLKTDATRLEKIAREQFLRLRN
ncbi:uncharacterized protein [Henckelia pumila]|uniref:uncharacterized protein n=1 Tax=Henckelia pumila TaxID=405737 RepID=UPI003C6E76BD